jgi:uncharacterized membrane protein
VNGDLIVMTFDGDEMAQTVYDSLEAMTKSHVLGLEDAAIVDKEGSGKIRLRPESEASAGLAALLGDLLLRLLLKSAPDGIEEYVDDEFLRTVGAALHDSGSALLFFLHPDSLSDTDELLSALALFRGRIYQTTLLPQIEDWLRETL